MKDCHTHPNLLKVPSQGRAFIERAISLGFSEITFTDHMPFTVTGDEVDRIPEGKVGEYCREVALLREEYKGRISVKTGIEIDYWPSSRGEIEEVLAAGAFDAVLGSSHLDILGFGVEFSKITCEDYAKQVLENTILAAETGLFTTIAHADIYRWLFYVPKRFPFLPGEFHWESCKDLYKNLFSVMQSKGLKLEINAAPLYKGFDNLSFYPEEGILNLSRDYGLSYVYGSDAHKVEHVGYGYEEVGKRYPWVEFSM